MHPPHDATHLEESRNKEQRKAGGFNYDILDELLGLQRTNQTGNFVAAFVSAAEPLTTHDGQRIRHRLKSQPEVSADYPRRMDWQWGVGCGWLLFDIFRGLAAGWWR